MSNKKKILFVHQANGLGGATKSLSILMSQMDREKYDLEIFLPGKDQKTVDFFENLGYSTYREPELVVFGVANGVSLGFDIWRLWTVVMFGKKFRQSIRVFKSFLEKNKPDLVYLNTIVLTPYGLASKKCGIKVIWHIREEVKRGFFKPWALLTRKIIQFCADRIICISSVNKEKLGIYSASVIYNYTNNQVPNEHEFSNIDKKHFGINEGEIVLAMLGGTVWSKGLPILLKAMCLVLNQQSNIRLIVAGHPIRPQNYSLFQHLKNLLRRQKGTSRECQHILDSNPMLKEKVLFLGFQNDVANVITVSDMLIWPGRVSHFARPIMEAFTLGKPVIATDFESSREIVIDGKNGLLFQPENAADLSKKILSLANNLPLARKMGLEGLAFAKEHFDTKNNSQKILNIIEETLLTSKAVH